MFSAISHLGTSMRSNRWVLSKYCFAACLITLVTGCSKSNDEAAVIAPTVLIRGMEGETRTVYSVSVVKPQDDAVMTDLRGEIILPPGVELAELLVPKSINRAYAALNKDGAVGLVWEQAQVAASAPVEPFSFALDAPLTGELEFYLRWTDENGKQVVENFFEVPPVFNASTAREDVNLSGEGYVQVGDTGVQLLAEDGGKPLALHVEVLPASFNPPESLGAIWWCSIVSIGGLPEGQSVQVVVPLRRPIAPFTALQLVRQATDGSWARLSATAIVTADGQYVTYVHPGGSIATGGPEVIRPEAVAVPPESVSAAQGIAKEGKGSTSEFSVFTSTTRDRGGNVIVVGQATAAPTAAPATAQPAAGGIQDGSSNTIIIGEATVAPPTAQPGSIQDGSSNTIIIGEATAVLPTAQPPPGNIQDGSSNTIIIGEATVAPPTAQPGNIQDGSSNTIIIGETTPTPVSGSGVTPTAAATAGPVVVPPSVELNPESLNGTAGTFGAGGVRIQIRLKLAGEFVQCQVGGVNCATVNRRTGTRGR
jgi:hypothetical protein